MEATNAFGAVAGNGAYYAGFKSRIRIAKRARCKKMAYLMMEIRLKGELHRAF